MASSVRALRTRLLEATQVKEERAVASELTQRLDTPSFRAALSDFRDGDGDGIESSSNDEDEATHNREATAQMVRDLLSAGGVVAVKLAQVIAEDPRVRTSYTLPYSLPVCATCRCNNNKTIPYLKLLR